MEKMARVIPPKPKTAVAPPRVIVPPVKYTKAQRVADVANAKIVLEKHYRTVRIYQLKVRGQDKVSAEYISLADNLDFKDLLRRTSEKGKKAMIAMAVEMLIHRLAELEKEGKGFDYHTFETKYQEALQCLPNSRGNGSDNYIKRTVTSISTAKTMIDDDKAASYGDINGNIKSHKPCGKPFWYKSLPKLVGYRLVWPALVFNVAWLDKGYKTKDGSGAQCFKWLAICWRRC